MTISLEYAAGMFDGEGYFTIGKCSPTNVKMGVRPMRLQAYAGLTIREKAICDAFEMLFGGFVRGCAPRRAQHSYVWRWMLSGPGLISFCQRLGPRCIIKQERCYLIEDFQFLKSGIRSRPITDVEYEKSVRLYWRLRELNQKGPKRPLVRAAA